MRVSDSRPILFTHRQSTYQPNKWAPANFSVLTSYPRNVPLMYSHILTPTDGSTQSKRAAKEAVQLAEEHNARLTILTVVREFDTGELSAPGAEGLEQRLQDVERQKGASRIEETMGEIESAEVDLETEIVAGVPHKAICEYIEPAGVDLVVLGTIGDDSLASYILGSTTERVTQRCDVPVLVV